MIELQLLAAMLLVVATPPPCADYAAFRRQAFARHILPAARHERGGVVRQHAIIRRGQRARHWAHLPCHLPLPSLPSWAVAQSHNAGHA